MSKVRVLVVEDSFTVRRRLVTTLQADTEFVVVGEAADGERAIAMCEQLRPDVISLDMMLPKGNGVSVTEHIMAYLPTPIVIVSASTNRGELLHTYDALAAGALDVVEKPAGTEPPGEWEQTFRERLKMAARIKVISHPRAKLRKASTNPPKKEPEKARTISLPEKAAVVGGRYSLIVMGASTGGPAAVLRILGAMRPIPLPIFLVIHIGQPFGAGLADWLGTVLPIPVMEAKHGDTIPPPGTACLIIAPSDRHMLLSGSRIHLDDGPECSSYRPSVDVLFESAAKSHGPQAIGCLLTGMGRDGAAGLLAMKQAGAMTIVQDEFTSVVFGMPREAIKLGAAKRILAIEMIGETLMNLAARSGG